MRRFSTRFLFAVVMTVTIAGMSAVYGGETEDAARVKTREQLSQLLDKEGPKINVEFRQSIKQPFNFTGTMEEGLTNCDSMEIVISVSDKQTIHFRIYPHYNGGYINVEKVSNSSKLMRQLLRFSDKNFLFWGMDNDSDVFSGYNFTLESGFPDESIAIVLGSIKNLDEFVGDMKPAIDGPSKHQ